MKILLQFIDGWEKITEIDNATFRHGILWVGIYPPLGFVRHKESSQINNIEIEKAKFVRTEKQKGGLPIFEYYE